MDLVSTVKYLYPNAEVLKDFTVADYGEGPVIEVWDTGKLGEQPSKELLENTWNETVRLKTFIQLRIDEFIRETKSKTGEGFMSNACGEDYFYSTLNTNEDRDQLNLTGAVISAMINKTVEGWTIPLWCTRISDNTLVFLSHTALQVLKVAADGKTAMTNHQLRLDNAIRRLRDCLTIEEAELVEL